MAAVAMVAMVAMVATVEVVGIDVEADAVAAVGAAAAAVDSCVLAIPLASSSDSSVLATPVVPKTYLQIFHFALQVVVDSLEECLQGSNGDFLMVGALEAVPLGQDLVDSTDQEHHDVVEPYKEEPSPA